MLRVVTPTGSMELLAQEERTLRGMSDEQVCRELNRDPPLFLFAALVERPHIQLDPQSGWTVVGTSLQMETNSHAST